MWVVALSLACLEAPDGEERDVPKRISDDEKGDVLLVCVVQDGVAVGLHHVPVGEEDGLAVERFLERQNVDQCLRERWAVDRLARRSFWTMRMLV